MRQRVRLNYGFSGTWPNEVRVHRWVDWQFLPLAGEELLIGDVLWEVETRAWVEDTAKRDVFVALTLRLVRGPTVQPFGGPRRNETEEELLVTLLSNGWER